MPFNRRTLLQRAALAGGGLLMPSLVARRQTVQHHHSASTLSRPSGFPVLLGATAASFSQAITVAHAGDVLIVIGGARSALTPVSGAGATWTQVIDDHAATGCFLWVGTGASAGAQTIVGTFAASIFYDLVIDSLHSSTPPTWTVTSSSAVQGTVGTAITMPSLSGSGVSAYVGWSGVANTPSAGSTPGFVYTETYEGEEYMLNVGLANGTAYAPTLTQSPSGADSNVAAVISNAGVGAVQPVGPVTRDLGGLWTLVFDDEFTGTTLDTTKWGYYPGGSNTGPELNNLASDPSLVTVSGGYLNLAVDVAAGTGGMVASGWAEDFTAGAGEGAAKGWALPVGGFVEARINFQGSGSTTYGWPSFWACRRLAWPGGGEYDIFEGYDGDEQGGYWRPVGGVATGESWPQSGNWVNGFHTFACYRRSNNTAQFWWDGVMIQQFTTSDNGTAASLIIQTGAGDAGPPASITGGPQPAPSGICVQVDYVRGWT